MQASLCPFCLKMVQTEICPYCGKDVNYRGYPNHLPVGFTLNGMHPYVMGAAIGQGGFGITYIAIDAVTNQRVAIKEYYPNHCCGRNNSTYVVPSYGQEETFTKGKQHFLEEAQMLQSLADIKSIVKVLDYFEANNAAYLVMEFLDGISLKDYVESSGKMSASVFLDQMKPMMEDMTKMHRRGVIHRDIAPDNIIMLQDGRLKLIDFGAARSYVGDKSMTVVVKKGFAPVEQYMRKGSSVTTDVYALAATIYYCLTGVIPPDSAARQYGEEVMMAPSLLGADLTPQQEHALEKALELQPKDRVQSVSGLQNLLFAAAPKPIGQQIIWEGSCHTVQKNCPVMVESLQLVYDYDRGTAIVRPVLRSLANGNLQKITVELWGEMSGGNRMSLAQYDIPCKNVKRNQFFGEENPVALPLGDLQDVRLSVLSVCFRGGMQIHCDSDWEVIAQQEPLENCLGSDPEILQEYRAETTVQAVWTPVAGDYYWRCGCGNLNLSEENICNRCGTGKQKLFAALDAEKLAETIAARNTEERRIEEENAGKETEVHQPEEEIPAEKTEWVSFLRKNMIRMGMNNRKRTIMIAAAVIAAAGIWIGSGALRNFRYQAAGRALEAGDFEKAYASYMQLADYRDSRQKMLAVKYAQGESLEAAEKYMEAVMAYESAAGYSDSAERAVNCQKEATYVVAKNLFSADDFDAAYTLFCELKEYRDSQEYAQVSGYNHAKALKTQKKYHEAYEMFQNVKDYKDSAALGQEAEYLYAVECMDAKQYLKSASAFARIKSYKDSEQLHSEAVYQHAGELAEDRQWEEAYELYSELENYKDSKTKYTETRYQYGCSQLDSKNYRIAAVAFDALGNYEESEEKAKEAKYLYVLENKYGDDAFTLSYLKELKEKKYKDSADLYNEIFGWKVKLIALNTDENDEDTILKSVCKDVEYLQIGFRLSGGAPGEKVTLMNKIVWPNGTTESSDWYWENKSDGSYIGIEWSEGPYKKNRGAAGTLTIKIYVKDTGDYVGEASVELTK